MDSALTKERMWLVAACGLLATGVAVAVALSGSAEGDDALVAVGRGLMVAVPIGVGLWAWHQPRARRFGLGLVAAGFGWSLTTLAESSNELLYSTGRVAGWLVEVGLLFLILAFPAGRITQRVDRRLAGALVLLVTTLYLPAIFLTQTFPVPSPYTSCTSGCPGNAFFLLNSEPGFVDSVLLPLREALTVLFFLAVVARLAQRCFVASPLIRRVLYPVLVVGLLRAAALAVGVGIRRIDSASAVPVGLSWTIALAVPAMALAFMLGLVLWQLYCAAALERLGRAVRPGLAMDELGGRLRASVGDPDLRLFHPGRSAGRWLDEQGDPVARRSTPPHQHLTRVDDGGEPLGLIVHDEALDDDPDFREAIVSLVRIALKSDDLTRRLESSLDEVRHSRARIVASADRERRRIERNLHDGAQQRLVALRVQLELTEELFEDNPAGAARKLHALGSEVTATLDEIRSLAHGVYPPLLADAGLAEALTAAARRLPIQASVEPDGAVRRFPGDVEGAVYFCCLEAMQNTSKHAPTAKLVKITLSAGDELRFEVSDDGDGFDTSANGEGVGLTNMRDRMAAVGGDLVVDSSPGHGTVVTGRVPVLGVGDGLRERPGT